MPGGAVWRRLQIDCGVAAHTHKGTVLGDNTRGMLNQWSRGIVSGVLLKFEVCGSHR
jgi:hypothetical protein